MQDILNQILPVIGPGGAGVLAAVIVYLKINGQRKDTKTSRDNDYKLLEYRVGQLENNQTALSESIKELQNAIIQLQVSVNTLVIEIKNLKENK